MADSLRSAYSLRRRVGFPHHVTQAPAVDAILDLEDAPMDLLWTVAVILLILWLLGLVTSYTVGGFIHILLVLALVVILIRVLQGRRPIP
jgi:hypothetical protein